MATLQPDDDTNGRTSMSGDSDTPADSPKIDTAIAASMQEDRALVDAFLHGGSADRKESGTRIWKKYLPAVSGYLHRNLPKHLDHEDACQDIFIRVFGNLDKLKNEDRLFSWIYRIMTNYVIDAYRCDDHMPTDSLDTKHELVETGPKPEDIAIQNDELGNRLKKLRPTHAIVLILFYLYGYTHKEIEDHPDFKKLKLGRNASVKDLLYRAKQEVRKGDDP